MHQTDSLHARMARNVTEETKNVTIRDIETQIPFGKIQSPYGHAARENAGVSVRVYPFVLAPVVHHKPRNVEKALRMT